MASAGRGESQITAQSSNWGAALFLSPILWGGIVTVAFYAAIPYLPIEREMAQRYFCGHWIEYVTTAMFFVGLCILGQKGLHLATERAALDYRFLGDRDSISEGDVSATATRVARRLETLPARLKRTHLARRVEDVCEYLASRRSSDGLEEHLKYRAELAAGALHDSYALVRTITWAIPILGFLGTVIGITLAIANLQPEQLANSLNEVTGGLAVAFDTTALSLALSLVLVFAAFLVERSEQGILGEVEEFGLQQIMPLFPETARPASTLLEAESQAARHLLEQTEQLVTWQTDLWRQAVESMRERWTESMTRQSRDLESALAEGMTGALADHAGQLATIRGEFLDAFRTASQDMAEAMQKSRNDERAWQAEFRGDFEKLWQRLQSGLDAIQDEQAARANALGETLSRFVGAWQSQLQHTAVAGQTQLEELRRQGEILSQVVAQEAELARLQNRLTENLEAVRAAETFEETLHSLNAAVHLLAGRTRPKAA